MPKPNELRASVQLTVYNQAVILVHDRRVVTLRAGQNTVEFGNVAADLDPKTVKFRCVSDPLSVYAIEQYFHHDLRDNRTLLSRHTGELVEVTANDGRAFKGHLMGVVGALRRGGEQRAALPEQIYLLAEDGSKRLISMANISDICFPAGEEAEAPLPLLRWQVRSSVAGEYLVEVTYLTQGLTWSADYTALLDANNHVLNLTGWATLENTTGATFDDAQVQLVDAVPAQPQAPQTSPPPPSRRLPPVGQDRPRVSPPGERLGGLRERAQQPSLLRRAQHRQQEAGNQRAGRFNLSPASRPTEVSQQRIYMVSTPVTIKQSEARQVNLLLDKEVGGRLYFVYDAEVAFSRYQSRPILTRSRGITAKQELQTWLELELAKADAGLPTGSLHVYQQTASNARLLVNHARLDAVTGDKIVRVALGPAEDLRGERMLQHYREFEATMLEESYRIRIHNMKTDQVAAVRIRERLFRWSKWQIMETSHDYHKLDASQVEFRVDVPAGEKATVTYTVRYTWPEGLPGARQ